MRSVTWCVVMMLPLLSGCIAALAIPVAAGIGVMGYTFLNIARDQYPDIDFKTQAPVETVYAKSFNDVWNGVVDTLMEMKETNAMTDRNSGIIRTNKKNLNDVGWISKGLGKSTFLYEMNITVREKNRRVSVEVMIPFWEEKFGETREKNIPEGSNMMRHIFYRNLNKRIIPVAERLPDGPMQDMGYAPAQPGDTMSEKPVMKKVSGQETIQAKPEPPKLKIKSGKTANIRTAPSTQGNTPFITLKGGTEVEKVEERGAWCRIRFMDNDGEGRIGWVMKNLLE